MGGGVQEWGLDTLHGSILLLVGIFHRVEYFGMVLLFLFLIFFSSFFFKFFFVVYSCASAENKLETAVCGQGIAYLVGN